MPVLSFTSGQLAGQSFEIGEEPVVLGRGDEANLPLNDSAASGRHAEIVGENGGWIISDLDSANGTEINGAQIESGTEMRVQNGDQVAFGGVVLKFQTVAP